MTLSKHRVAVVTGASRGLGRAIALRLATEGCSLALTARDSAALESVVTEAKQLGTKDAIALPADLSLPDAPGEVIKHVIRHFGHIDILINNAGDTQRGDFLELSDDLHLSGFALKYHATVRFCRAAWESLEASKGCIVNISGIGAQTPDPLFSIGGPVNSALINFSKAISKRPGAPRVNVVCPGHIETDRLTHRINTFAVQNGISRTEAKQRLQNRLGLDAYGKPEDIASMVGYLCSPEAGYITGSTFIVDGGATPGI
ncbi:3-oxoacyl-[acyl-carrier protein] reductase [Roseovarius pacificus]|uniref:3-oxoacyl-[acyl-carrier protein] reductase n=1 Tax=Roseovarius pacificus TaxID=337701 RepID=A0A1M7AGJ7_9RHOB|nr:SDR family oxidoreductase [Roseovarius pacificus]GGO53474.1 short-chain dehydrogenase [Roseovarius pacificus]SHL41921.1 3-oxoacyl-[acyl-carrier protein] reductase [Roseovarius pacificus]